MPEPYRRMFPRTSTIIGMIALQPSPGLSGHAGMPDIVGNALRDLDALQRGGVHGVCVENDFDRPHSLKGGPEVIAAMTRATSEVVKRARVPVGVQVLLDDPAASLAIALASGARFVRLDFFVDKVRIAAGDITPDPDAVLRYRERIGAGRIALFCDIQVKYSRLLEEGKTLSESAAQAMAAGADAIIVTGSASGQPPALADLRETRAACGSFPVLIGSGLTAQNAAAHLPYADGAIVGTSLRASPEPGERVRVTRVRALMRAIGAR